MVWFLCFWASQGLTLKSGQILICDAYLLKEKVVIVQLKGETYSLPKHVIDWDTPVAMIADDSHEEARAFEATGDLADSLPIPQHVFFIEKLEVKQASLVDVLRLLADQVGFNLIIDQEVPDTLVTFSFTKIPWQDAMSVLLRSQNLSFEYSDQLLQVGMFTKYSGVVQ